MTGCPPASGEPVGSPSSGLASVSAGGGAEAALFPVFLLLAAFMAALLVASPPDPGRTALARASIGERFTPAPSAPSQRSISAALDQLDRLRSALGMAAIEAAAPRLDGAWLLDVPGEFLFEKGGAEVRAEARPFVYRLARVMADLEEAGSVLSVTMAADGSTLAAPRLAALGRRLTRFGAPPSGLRLRLARQGDDGVYLVIAPLPPGERG